VTGTNLFTKFCWGFQQRSHLVILEFHFFRFSKLTQNRNISSVSFGLFLTVYNVFLMDFFYSGKLLLSCWIQIRWKVWDICIRSRVISKYIFDCLTVRDFFHQKVLFDIKIYKIWTRQASFVLFFPPDSCGQCLSCYDNCTLLKNNKKSVTWPIIYLSKKHF
jgi:hypothetical protein